MANNSEEQRSDFRNDLLKKANTRIVPRPPKEHLQACIKKDKERPDMISLYTNLINGNEKRKIF